jgi:hypothetical protein
MTFEAMLVLCEIEEDSFCKSGLENIVIPTSVCVIGKEALLTAIKAHFAE